MRPWLAVLSLASACLIISGCTLIAKDARRCDPADDFCPDGYHCENGVCAPNGDSDVDPCEGVTCEGREVCDPDGRCVLPPVPGTWELVEAGTFFMGSPGDEAGRYDDETRHEVTLTRDFELQSTEVTQVQFEEVMGYNPSDFTGCGTCPVETVSWHEAAAYCNGLSERAWLESCYQCVGNGADVECDLAAAYETAYDCPGYRLPTEAEWEYAARAGTTTATYNGDLDARRLSCESPNAILDPIAWFCGNSDSETHEVGTLAPNDWGLYDMLGNVWEWCHDWYDPYPSGSVTDPTGPSTGSYRVLRGGSWGCIARDARAAYRDRNTPGLRSRSLGFRPSRSCP